LDISSGKIIGLLKTLISIPSFSGEEKETADAIALFMQELGIPAERLGNNLLFTNASYREGLPVIMLNSHHDTVKPGSAWTVDPFTPAEKGDRIYGLGSNDAGGALVALIATFLHYYSAENLKYNLMMVASAEEENTGANGMQKVLDQLEESVDFAIVGEPTSMKLAIAEKGLMVLDCLVRGKSGHAAREEGDNAIYKAMKEIGWFREFRFPTVSDTLGPVKMTVTVIDAGRLHNVVPDICTFTVDVRSTDAYSNEEILQLIREHVQCEIHPRSTRLQPSGIAPDHPIVNTAKRLGIETFGSPTCSDQTIMRFPSVKIGPGDSGRSHTADEYIEIPELLAGIDTYKRLLDQIII